MRQLSVPLGGTLLLVVMLASLLYPLAATQIAYPLRNLAERLCHFDPAKNQGTLKSSDYQTLELAEIVDSFNVMTIRVRKALSELRQKIEEIETKNELLHQAQRRLEWLANYDPLTGVLNRRTFMERCLQLVRKAKVSGFWGVMLMVDVDNFKTINDCYGHAVGDTVLKKVAGTLMNCIRKDDLVGRYGGDEFILFFLLSHPEEVNALGQRIHTSLCRKLELIPEFDLDFSISVCGAVVRLSSVVIY